MSFWQENVVIGNRSFPRFMSGPLDGVTDSPFRQLVRLFSARELLYTEMRHVGSLVNDKRERAFRFHEVERPLSFQIAAGSLEYIDDACQKIMACGVDVIDLNVGCPARNVTSSGCGSALMADIPRLTMVVSHLRKAITNIPFTVKIRAGFKEKNALEVAQRLQDCGVDALAIHPRLQTQLFTGRPDYALAAAVKKQVTIPVLLSGNIINWTTARLAYEQTGVDGFLIGRGMWSKPWKLEELRQHALGNPWQSSAELVFSLALRHLDLMFEHYGPRGLYIFRKHLPFYLKGVPTAAELRRKLLVSVSLEEVKETLQNLGKGLCG
jgi:tRNA-dihydrouridine synthase B